MRKKKIAMSTVLAAVALLSAPAAAMAHGDTTDPAEDPALCAPYMAINAAFAGEPDPAVMEELLVEAEAAAPEDVADTLGVLTGAVRTILETGDFAAFETPEVTEAKSEMDTWVFESCAFDTKLEVSATDYAFGGLPEELPAGSVAIALHNDGEEAHEIVLLRKLADTTESWDDLLALPQEEILSKAEFVGVSFVPAPGTVGVLTGELVAGEYIALCFIPEGSVAGSEGSVAPDAMPHFMHGMRHEFTVTG
jgi:hypothetical protein